MRISPEDVAPIVELVADLEEGSGGHESKYGSLSDIEWRLDPRDEYLRVSIRIDHWVFWEGDQLTELKQRIRCFADRHGDIADRIFYFKQDTPIGVSLKIPAEEGDTSD